MHRAAASCPAGAVAVSWGRPIEVEDDLFVVENVTYLRGRDGIETQARSAWVLTFRDGQQTSLTLPGTMSRTSDAPKADARRAEGARRRCRREEQDDRRGNAHPDPPRGLERGLRHQDLRLRAARQRPRSRPLVADIDSGAAVDVVVAALAVELVVAGLSLQVVVAVVREDPVVFAAADQALAVGAAVNQVPSGAPVGDVGEPRDRGILVAKALDRVVAAVFLEGLAPRGPGWRRLLVRRRTGTPAGHLDDAVVEQPMRLPGGGQHGKRVDHAIGAADPGVVMHFDALAGHLDDEGIRLGARRPRYPPLAVSARGVDVDQRPGAVRLEVELHRPRRLALRLRRHQRAAG
jgi:hypothetical protein